MVHCCCSPCFVSLNTTGDCFTDLQRQFHRVTPALSNNRSLQSMMMEVGWYDIDIIIQDLDIIHSCVALTIKLHISVV